MPYAVSIRDNATGEIRDCPQSLPWHDDNDDGNLFWWLKGNMSCDCNRKMEFVRAGGDDPYKVASPCGESAYTITKIQLDTGRLVEFTDDLR